MEVYVCAQSCGLGFDIVAALLDTVLDVGEFVEVLVDDGLVDEALEILGGLAFRGIERQVDGAQAFRDA